MNVWQAIALGIIQGLTEFLPVSSSGHIAIFSKLFSVDVGSQVVLCLTMHIGTLFSVLLFYFKDIIKMLKADRQKLLYLLFATLPAGLFGYLFSGVIDKVFFTTNYLCLSFFLSAVLMFLASILSSQSAVKMKTKHSIFMGIAQCIALFPAVSRSGATISVGIYSGLKKEEAVNFSFLMSIPIILGGILYELITFDTSLVSSQTNLLTVTVALITSFIFGMLAIKFMIKTLNKISFKWFSLYLLVLSALCFLFA